MEQLKMYYVNDGKPACAVTLPEGFRVVRFPDLPDALDKWLDLMQYGLSEKREDASFYKTCMTDLPTYDERLCFFIAEGDRAAATVTILCDREKKHAVCHMVACDPAYRGKGLGNALSAIFVSAAKEEGMLTASLRTDDWRVPAIKTYLKYGFTPDLSSDDYKLRWKTILEQIGR